MQLNSKELTERVAQSINKYGSYLTDFLDTGLWPKSQNTPLVELHMKAITEGREAVVKAKRLQASDR